MIHAQEEKDVVVIAPAAIKDNASFTATATDTLGFGYCKFRFILGATDIAMSALKLQESDDDSTYTDVDGADFSVDGTLPSATDDNKIVGIGVVCGNSRKRYLKPVAAAGDGSTGTFMTAIATLSRGSAGITTAAEAGMSQFLKV